MRDFNQTFAQRLAAAAAGASAHVPTELADELRALSDIAAVRERRSREQRVGAGRARAERVAREGGEWWSLAARQAARLRAADPSLSQAALAELLIAALPGRLPQRDAVIRRIRGWERSSSLPPRRANPAIVANATEITVQ